MEQKQILDDIGPFVSSLPQVWREAPLPKAGALQNAILNNANFSSIATDENGVIQLFNIGAEHMLGYTAAEVVNKFTPADISDPAEVIARSKALSLELATIITPGFEALVYKASRGIEDIYELTYIRKDGSRFPAVVSVTALRDAQNNIIGYLLIGTDNTARKQIEAERQRIERALQETKIELENAKLAAAEGRTEQAEGRFIEAQKMGAVGHLAAGVAHDFNNILGVIMGYSDFIKQEAGPDHPLQKYNKQIRQEADRAVGLTRQLLIFSRKQTVQPVVLDLNNEVMELKTMLTRLVHENIEIIVLPGKDTGRINADSGYIGQVLMNLIVNARDAMPNGGTVTIVTDNVTLGANYALTHPGTAADDYVMLSVSDTGIGMTEEVKSHLFEAFFTTKPMGKGTGLGLATCQTIVQQSGGHIDVQSEVGKGTTFNIYFPRVDLPLDSARRREESGPLPRGTETVLIVEDEPSVRDLARGMLEAQGYDAMSAANGQHALHLMRAHKGSPIPLVITDVIMPQMGGKVMAEWLRVIYPDIKILFTSGYPDNTMLQQLLLTPGIEFLPKPYAPSTLIRKVREMLDVKIDGKNKNH